LCCLKEHTNVVSLDDYFSGNLSSEKVNVIVTFDDGYKSWVTTAAPVLGELQIPATFFISSGFLDLSKADAENFLRSNLKTNLESTGALTGADVRRLAEDGFTIGGHTFTHVNMEEVSSQSDILREIVSDKEKLQSIIGKNVNYFAYPFGGWNNPKINLIDLLKEAGYKAAVTTVAGFNTPTETNSYLLHRDLTGTPTPVYVFKARALGTYDAVSFLKRQAPYPHARRVHA
jgi:peptidoglycan/xylan/chitin deacetylase (PgdA/CDA1 family)